MDQKNQTKKATEIKKLISFKERKDIIYSELGKPIREFLGEDLVHNIVNVWSIDHKFFKDLSLEDEVKHLIERYGWFSFRSDLL